MGYSLHTYLNPLRQEGAPAAYIEAVQRNAQPLAVRGLPIILSLAHLAQLSGAPYNILLRIVDRRIDPYRIFAIRKYGGGKRFICVPEPMLLRAQRFIHRHILCAKQVLNGVSESVTAYRPGSSHIANASRHVDAEWLVKLDITNFFESISERQVYHVFRGLGYRALVAFELSRLCTRVLPFDVDRRRRGKSKRWMPGDKRKFLSAPVVGHLPQGAPTSPMLANLVCASLDSSLQAMADGASLTFTRYADDLFGACS